MFFTGLSSPIISILIASFLPWVLFFFGKSASKEIQRIAATSIEAKLTLKPCTDLGSFCFIKEKEIDRNDQAKFPDAIFNLHFFRFQPLLSPSLCEIIIRTAFASPVLRGPPSLV